MRAMSASARCVTSWLNSITRQARGPPAALVSVGHSVVVSVGPWQPRCETCAASTAGVASVSSAVETSPVLSPRFCARSRTVCRFRPGVVIDADGPCEMRSSSVFWPVAHCEPVEAESGS